MSIRDFYYSVYSEEVPKIPPGEFSGLAERAVGEIKYMSPFTVEEPYTPEVLSCICEVAELLYETDKIRNIEREDIDGYSVTYRSGAEAEIRRIIEKRLMNTGLLCRRLTALE